MIAQLEGQEEETNKVPAKNQATPQPEPAEVM
jgi:hypothetical protein